MDINLTLIGQSIAMLVFVWFCMKFIWPPLVAAIEERREKIADGLAAGERAEQDLIKAKEEAAGIIGEARSNALEIVAQANQRSNEMVDEARGKASSEAERIKAQAHAEIAQEIEQARSALRREVAAIAVGGAKQLLGREINEAANADLLEKLANEL
ncbi:MAG: F0F1 ATP synthase subunit B [Gammaproteobacteria bacterium]|nr:F0F1 ATP synthase subunit B [Gammaproteobacteria bacterium]